MGLTLASIRRPVFISMFVLALIILGIRARNDMPKEARPEVEFPMVTVVTAYPGAGPQEIETLISQPMEEAVAGINGVKHVNSTSRDGLSVVAIEFELGTNLDSASADVRDKVSGARGDLPRDATEPAISRVNITGGPILTMGMTGPLPPQDLRLLADTTVTDAFSKVPGTAAVYVDGGRIREIQVQVDKSRLQAYGMSLSQVVQAINQTNLNVPSGTVKEQGREYSVRMVGEFSSPRQIENVRITVPGRTPNGRGAVVQLRDVARVSDTVAETDRITRLGIGDKKPTEAVIIAVQKQSGGNTLATAAGVKAEMARLMGQVIDKETHEPRDYDPTKDAGGGPGASGPPTRILPPGVNMIIATDESEYVQESLDDVNKSLVEGVFLVVVIVFLFLHSARATFIVALAIPTSLFATFLPLHALGYTLNFMTLLGLSLAVGILVDDSIVVLENIERHLRKGEEPFEAAVNGRSEIGLAAIAITLVDVVVFLPIANMGGIVGQFFRPFGWAVAISTLFSLFMSFTLTPMLASRFFPKGHGSEAEKMTRRGFWSTVFRRFDRLYEAWDRVYENILAWTLQNRALTIWTGWATLLTVIAMMGNAKVAMGIAVTVMLGVGALFSKDRLMAAYIWAALMTMVFMVRLPLPFEFFPSVDQGEFGMSIEAPVGTSLPVTDRAVRRIADEIRQLKDANTGKSIVEFVTTNTGASSSGASQGAGEAGSQYGSVSVKLVDKDQRTETVKDIQQRVVALTATVPGVLVSLREVGGIGGKPISMEVTGPDMDQNVRTANALLARMKQLPGITDADTSWKTGKPELRVEVDGQRAADKGMAPAQIGAALRTALQGSGEGGDTKYREGGDEFVIRVQYNKLDRSNANEVAGLIIGSSNGKPVLLQDVARVTLTNAPTSINRRDRQRLITVDANVAPGSSQGNMQQEVNKVAAAIPTGSSRIQTGGTGQMMAESFGYMISALLLAVVLVYMVMAALFESLTTPFVIWLTLPQALVGALLGLMVTSKTFSLIAMIGIVMLMGLVTKNAILLIDYTNTLRARGKDRTTAILEAGPTRLRPVMMTTLAMIGGMMPTALAVSKGAEQRQPMAIAVIGGLILSTVLTLLVIPVTYTLMDDLVTGTRSRWISLVGRRGRDARRAMAPNPEPVGGE